MQFKRNFSFLFTDCVHPRKHKHLPSLASSQRKIRQIPRLLASYLPLSSLLLLYFLQQELNYASDAAEDLKHNQALLYKTLNSPLLSLFCPPPFSKNSAPLQNRHSDPFLQTSMSFFQKLLQFSRAAILHNRIADLNHNSELSLRLHPHSVQPPCKFRNTTPHPNPAKLPMQK